MKSKFEITVRRPVAIVMIVLGIVVFGLVSFSGLNWNLMPDISYPSFTIRTEYPGAAPEEVENVVSRPLEEQLGLIKDLMTITSISRPEQSDIILEFNWDVDMDRAASEIREKLDQVHLDESVERPMILRYDPSLDPVIRFGLVSDLPLMKLRELTEDEIARVLETITGVASARVKGGLEREILIKVDETKLNLYHIPFNLIENRLAEENINLAGGNVKEGDTEYIIRTLNEFTKVSEIGEVIIIQRDGITIRLKDIAQIEVSHKERDVITRVNGRESIEISIYKEADANIVTVCDLVKKRIFGTDEQQKFVAEMEKKEAEMKKKQAEPEEPADSLQQSKTEKPKKEKKGGPHKHQQEHQKKQMTHFIGYEFKDVADFFILADQSTFIKNSINEVKNTAIWGGIFAVIVLYLFLRSFSTTAIVSLSIPISIVATFIPLKFFNISLNMMSLGGLALGIGMLVDNSIVVIESIFRCREEGDNFVDSVIRGTSEVGSAVIASTLTTIAVFFPIVFVEGVAGQIFGDLSLAVVFSLIASLVVALFFIPMLASRKFDHSKMKSHFSFRFKFEDEKKWLNYLLIIPQSLIFILKIIFSMLVYFLLALISIPLMLFYPLLSIKNLNHKIINRINQFLEKKQGWSLLWEGYLSILPLSQFKDSIAATKLWVLLLVIPYLYFVIRFMIHLITFSLTRIIFTFLSLLLLLGKTLFVMIFTLIYPVILLVGYLFNRLINRLLEAYPNILRKALNKDNQIIVTLVVLFLITLFFVLPHVGTELIPEVHQGTFYVNTTMPVGTPVEKNDSILSRITETISKVKDVDNVNYYAGTTQDDMNSDEIGEHIGRITVNVQKGLNIAKIEQKVISKIREQLVNIADLQYQISRPVLFSFKTPIEIEIKGYNIEQLRTTSLELKEKIESLPGLKDVESTIKEGYPELMVQFDRNKLSHFGLDSYSVANLIKNKIEGSVATRFKEEERRIDIRVYLKDEQRMNALRIPDLIVNPGDTIPIQLKSVATIKNQNGPNEIRRINQERSAVISANISDISLNEAVDQIITVLEDYSFPLEFSYQLSGQNREMENSKNSMYLALILAIFLVYIVMASQFESFLHPFFILFSIPMAFIGVIWVLFALNISMGVTVFIGMITLAGIVVNNAIVLIDYINLLRSKGSDKIDAIVQAGKVRIRPIMITTLTTVLGLLPMAIGMGEGAEIRVPMAITIIAGLISSTFLTLVLIPVVYKKFSP